MKRIYRVLLLLSCMLVIGMKANAQRIFFVKPKGGPSITADPNQVKIIIHFSSDKLAMTHNMDEEGGVRTTNDDGTYRYTISYSFPEDYEDDLTKSTFLVQLSVGQKDLMPALRKGKGYMGTSNENLIMIGKNNDGLFPQSKTTKVMFLSTMKKLDTECNGKLCFSDGQAVLVVDVNFSSSAKQEGGKLNTYIIGFTLDEEKRTPASTKRPILKIKVGASNAIDVDLRSDLESRKSYSYTIVSNVKIVEEEASFDELLAKAQTKEREADFFAAANTYQGARSHESCPMDKRGGLEAQLGRMNSARKLLFYMEKLERQGARAERKEGFMADSVFTYYHGTIRSYKKMLGHAPGITELGRRAEELGEELGTYLMNSKVTAVTVKYREIIGRYPGSGEIPIYTSNTPDNPKPSSDDKPLGATRGDGSFRVVFKDASPPYLYFYGDKKSYKIGSTATEIVF